VFRADAAAGLFSPSPHHETAVQQLTVCTVLGRKRLLQSTFSARRQIPRLKYWNEGPIRALPPFLVISAPGPSSFRCTVLLFFFLPDPVAFSNSLAPILVKQPFFFFRSPTFLFRFGLSVSSFKVASSRGTYMPLE